MSQLESLIASSKGLTLLYSAATKNYTIPVPSSYTQQGYRNRSGKLIFVPTSDKLIAALKMDNGHFSAISLPLPEPHLNFSNFYIGVHYIPHEITVIEKTDVRTPKEKIQTITQILYDTEINMLIYNGIIYPHPTTKLQNSPVTKSLSEFDCLTLLSQNNSTRQNSSYRFKKLFLTPKSSCSPQNPPRSSKTTEKIDLSAYVVLLAEARHYDILDQEQEFILAQSKDHANYLMTNSLAYLFIEQRHKNPLIEKPVQELYRLLENLPTTPPSNKKEDEKYRSSIQAYLDIGGKEFYPLAKSQLKNLEQFLQSTDHNTSRRIFASLPFKEAFQQHLLQSLIQYVQSEVETHTKKQEPSAQLSPLPPSLYIQTQLLELYTIAQATYHQTINQFILHNLRLISSVAKPFIRRGLAPSEAMSHGILGVRRAAIKYEWQRGFKFSTYATWWIKQAIKRYNIEEGSTIYVPVHIIECKDKLVKLQTKFFKDHHREPTFEELSVLSKIPAAKVEIALNLPNVPRSLDEKIGDPDDRDAATLMNFINGSDAERLHGFVHIPQQANQAAEDDSLRMKMRKALASLHPREEAVLRYRNGIEAEELTLEEVGHLFHVTRERIRQIEGIAERKLIRRLQHMGINANNLFEPQRTQP